MSAWSGDLFFLTSHAPRRRSQGLVRPGLVLSLLARGFQHVVLDAVLVSPCDYQLSGADSEVSCVINHAAAAPLTLRV